MSNTHTTSEIITFNVLYGYAPIRPQLAVVLCDGARSEQRTAQGARTGPIHSHGFGGGRG